MHQSFTLVLKSEFKEAEKTNPFIEEIDDKTGLGDDLKDRMMLALNEAAVNAIIHGNREDSGKLVLIEVLVDDDSVVMTIEDQGEGFDPSEIPDPVTDKNLLKPGGRGLFLIENYCDDVTYSKGGSLVTLRFDR